MKVFIGHKRAQVQTTWLRLVPQAQGVTSVGLGVISPPSLPGSAGGVPGLGTLGGGARSVGLGTTAGDVRPHSAPGERPLGAMSESSLEALRPSALWPNVASSLHIGLRGCGRWNCQSCCPGWGRQPLGPPEVGTHVESRPQMWMAESRVRGQCEAPDVKI